MSFLGNVHRRVIGGRVFSFEVIVPRFEGDIAPGDEARAVTVMATRGLQLVVERTRRGWGSRGALPRPKDGGRAYYRTGQLQNSIGVRYRLHGRTPVAFIEPMGERSDVAARAAGRRRTLKRRKNALAAELKRRGATKEGIKILLKTVRANRLAGKNMDVAAILANEPKDLRGRNGGRGRYDVFFMRPEERQEMRRIAAREVRVFLRDGAGGIYKGDAK